MVAIAPEVKIVRYVTRIVHVYIVPCFQAYSYTREQIIGMMEFLIECGPPQFTWEPVKVFYKLSCVPLMLQLISAACDWKTYYGR